MLPAEQRISISRIALFITPPSFLTPSHSSSLIKLTGIITFNLVLLDTLKKSA